MTHNWLLSKQNRLSTSSSSPPAVVEEPMQLGRIRQSPEKRQRRLWEGKCIYFAQLGHLITSCPVKGEAQPLVQEAQSSH